MKKYLTLSIVDEKVVDLHTRLDGVAGFRLLGEYDHWEIKQICMLIECQFFYDQNTFIIKNVEATPIKIVLNEHEIAYKRRKTAEHVAYIIKNPNSKKPASDLLLLKINLNHENTKH